MEDSILGPCLFLFLKTIGFATVIMIPVVVGLYALLLRLCRPLLNKKIRELMNALRHAEKHQERIGFITELGNIGTLGRKEDREAIAKSLCRILKTVTGEHITEQAAAATALGKIGLIEYANDLRECATKSNTPLLVRLACANALIYLLPSAVHLPLPYRASTHELIRNPKVVVVETYVTSGLLKILEDSKPDETIRAELQNVLREVKLPSEIRKRIQGVINT